jgi:tRNA(fMet)-specific endonuclease VapC
MMPARYMLDTDSCIYLRKRRPPAVEERFRTLQQGEVVMSLITYGELRNGALKSSAPAEALANIQRLAEVLPVQPMSAKTAEYYGEIRAALEQSGQIIGGNDLWIAAHALALNLILVTTNPREFSRIPQLALENWLDV